jgi:ABC-type antimicrobial peptide transport system permease subunit
MLVAGSMPENDNEIVIAMPSYNLDSADEYVGVEFESNLFRALRAEDTLSPLQNITVSGVVSSSEIHMKERTHFLIGDTTFDALHRYFYTRYTSSSRFVPDDPGVFGGEAENRLSLSHMPIKIDNDLPDDTIALPKSFAGPDSDVTVAGTLEISDYYRELTLDGMTLAFTDSNEDYGVYMNEATYARFALDDVYQISVLSGTDIGVKGLQKDIENIDKGPFTGTFKAVYPYASDTESDFSALVLLLQSIGMVALIFVAMVGSTLLTYLIFRAIINTKLHDYAIFRTIGANQGIIRRFIYIENLYVTAVAYVIFLAVALSVGRNASTGSIFYPLRTYSWFDYIVFLGLLVLMSLVVSSKYCKRIFKSSVSKTMRTEGELR